jgi:hypothetical protein
MSNWKKTLTAPAVTMVVFLLAVGLLLFSTVGGARAALTYYSENYTTRVQVYDIGVSLQENGQVVAGQYDGTGTLLTDLLPEGESLKLGVTYPEVLTVQNTGTIDQYVRVNLYKYWTDADGNKVQNLSPDLIDLALDNLDSDWLVDEDASTPERTVLYYNKVLTVGEVSPALTQSLTISSMVGTKVTQSTTTTEDGYTTITTVYDYDGYRFNVEAKVDAVQEHNAEDAIWSAWGRQVSVTDGILSLN